MPGFGWGLAATVATGLLVSTPFFSGTLTPVEPETVQRLGEAQGHALAAITESMPRLDRPQTQPQPQPGVETAVLPGRADDGVSEGLLTAEENGWAKVHRKPGYTEVDVLDPATGKVLQTIRLVSDAGIGDRIRKQVEAGWVRLEPMGNGWS
ncbi:MAG: hypothetical protein ACAI25_11885, partial [Planctomycetota bacterium]